LILNRFREGCVSQREEDAVEDALRGGGKGDAFRARGAAYFRMPAREGLNLDLKMSVQRYNFGADERRTGRTLTSNAKS